MPLPHPSEATLKEFAFWLSLNRSLPGAEVARQHFDNSTGQQRQGHFKQSFCASYRFLHEHPEFVEGLSGALDTLGPDDVFDIATHEVAAEWIAHVERQKLVKGDLFDYSILRGVLPPALGGLREGGGGGAGTLQRVLPLTARWLFEKQSKSRKK